jgi:predicted MFS family arabinose efflux permease
VLVIGAPIVAAFLRNAPEDVDLSVDGIRENWEPTTAPVPPAGFGVVEALRTGLFWQLCAIFLLVSACVNGTVAHLAPMLSDRGISGRDAALATSFFGAATIVGRLGNGYLVDRLPAHRVAAMMFFGATLGLPMLLVVGGRGWFFTAAALIGLAIGAESDVMPFLVSRYFGMRSMRTLFGCIFASYTIGAAAGAYFLGAGLDATSSYRTPLEFATAAMLFAALATLGLKTYKSR